MFQTLSRSYNSYTKRYSPVTGQRSVIASLPAPLGGWNARDAIPDVSAVKTLGSSAEALVLDNWLPTYGGLQVRKGYTLHVTGLTGDYVESLMPYHPSSGTAKLFAATPTIIYDVTTVNSPSSSQTGLTNGRWSHVNFSTAAVKVLYICNGADTPRYWDGSNWTNSTFTGSGLTITNLDYVHAHLFRLWFIEKDTLNAWYAPVTAVAGTLNKLDLGAMCRRGGKLVAIASWTRDGGAGPDDYIVFITSQGEVVIYAGTDPTTITGSALVGVYKIPEPLGRRCFLPLGADLAVLTRVGVVSLSQVLATDESTAANRAITDKISGAFQKADHGASTAFGWEMVEYAHEQLAIVNVPVVERDTQHQFVLNTATGAWCRFKAINAGCWGLFNGKLYFGGNDGTVNLFDDGTDDVGSPIVAEMMTAFSNFNHPGLKVFNMARPVFVGSPDFLPKVKMRIDYDTEPASLETTVAEAGGTAWDVGDWDESDWDLGHQPVVRWQSVTGAGIAGAVAFAVGALTPLVFNGVDVNYEIGGPL